MFQKNLKKIKVQQIIFNENIYLYPKRKMRQSLIFFWTSRRQKEFLGW
jgi:hypothetical protein